MSDAPESLGVPDSADAPISAKLPARKYKCDEITVTYQPRRCTHVGECMLRAPSVFNTWELPWVQVKNGTVAEIVEAIERCPTGALHYERTDGGSQEQPCPTNVVFVSRNGPYYVSGNLEIVMPDGSILTETRASLCRCGVSTNRPFRDNSHREVRFRDPGMHVPEMDVALELPPNEKLRITPHRNGNLHFEGAFEIRDATGTVIAQRAEEWLCRCGHSGNKPFCDSTHKRIGFKTE